MKRTYMKPTTKVVQIHHRQLLTGSPYTVETYDDEEDVINQKNSIW